VLTAGVLLPWQGCVLAPWEWRGLEEMEGAGYAGEGAECAVASRAACAVFFRGDGEWLPGCPAAPGGAGRRNCCVLEQLLTTCVSTLRAFPKCTFQSAPRRPPALGQRPGARADKVARYCPALLYIRAT